LGRNDFGAGLTNGESEDGGLEEFREFWFSRASRSTTRANSPTFNAPNRSISRACATTSAANSSYEGFGAAVTPP
jgi:hypothetical protein